MPARKNPAPEIATGVPSLTFEAALDRLRTIVDELERGELTLDESIERYEEGMKLSKRLTHQLDEAEKRIERLIESGDENEPPTTQPMEFEPRSNDTSEGELPF
jgi:exodeoxyribonuclease VII small subunit